MPQSYLHVLISFLFEQVVALTSSQAALQSRHDKAVKEHTEALATLVAAHQAELDAVVGEAGQLVATERSRVEAETAMAWHAKLREVSAHYDSQVSGLRSYIASLQKDLSGA